MTKRNTAVKVDNVVPLHTTAASANPLAEKAVLAGLTVRCWTGRKLDRKVTDKVNEEYEAAPDAGRYNKMLIKPTAFVPVFRACNAARAAHREMTQPWFDEYTRILPTALYDKFATQFRTLRADFESATEEFCRNYPRYIRERQKELGAMFREEDYPSPKRVETLFGFDIHITPVPDVNDFRVSLAREQAEDIRTNLEAHVKIALQAAMAEPVKRIVQVVGRMAERLKSYRPADGGTRAQNTFRDSLVGNIQELAELLPAFNLINDPKLTKLTERMVVELCPVDAQLLREDPRVRAKTAKAAEEILAQAEALMA